MNTGHLFRAMTPAKRSRKRVLLRQITHERQMLHPLLGERAGVRADVTTFNLQPSTFPQRGMSLIEILVAVTLLVVIILGLTAMFNQTRKAFTLGLANVDYQDAGRSAMDIITRDLQQMAPNDYTTYNFPTATRLGTYSNVLNFYANTMPAFITNFNWPMLTNSPVGDSTNFSIEELYFVTQDHQNLDAIGYGLLSDNAHFGIGTLYRYQINNAYLPNLMGPAGANPPCVFSRDFADNVLAGRPSATAASFSPVMDNVVDFRIRAYDRYGVLISATNPLPVYQLPGPGFNPNLLSGNATNGDYEYMFASNAVPAYVEVELGVMEAPTVALLQALTNSEGTPSLNSAYWKFLTSHAAQVHVFRQRIAIPAVDPKAYPPYQ